MSKKFLGHLTDAVNVALKKDSTMLKDIHQYLVDIGFSEEVHGYELTLKNSDFFVLIKFTVSDTEWCHTSVDSVQSDDVGYIFIIADFDAVGINESYRVKLNDNALSRVNMLLCGIAPAIRDNA
jgi:hypothetical protein